MGSVGAAVVVLVGCGEDVGGSAGSSGIDCTDSVSPRSEKRRARNPPAITRAAMTATFGSQLPPPRMGATWLCAGAPPKLESGELSNEAVAG